MFCARLEHFSELFSLREKVRPNLVGIIAWYVYMTSQLLSEFLTRVPAPPRGEHTNCALVLAACSNTQSKRCSAL